MDEDEPLLKDNEPLLDDEEVLAKASFQIITLHYLRTLPPPQLIACTKCLQCVLASSLITHSVGHNIRLLPNEK